MLRSAGYTVLVAASGEEGFDLARGDAFDVILSDMRMPGLSGLDILKKLRDVNVDACFIVMTGFGTVDTAVEAMKLGAVDFVQKPFFRDELLMRVRAATDRRQLARQVTLLQRQLPASTPPEGLVGRSDVMAKVKEVIRRAAAAPGTVLITGETGTGKELAARAIHAGSPRASKPFVALNCAALTESLLENELFGHTRGAFTGAAAPRSGLIEHASGGTLFLDEIGTMSTALQAKLLRAVESGEVRRIGENESRRVDVRFVTATNVDLKAAVDGGSFRSDLYYRVNVHRVHMPPLRERGGDVPLLVEHFLERYGRSANITGVAAPAIEVLESVLVSGKRATARAHHPASGRHRAAARAGPRRSPRGAPRTGTAASTAIGRDCLGRERARGTRDDRDHARALSRRDQRHGPRAPSESNYHVASDEEARHRSRIDVGSVALPRGRALHV